MAVTDAGEAATGENRMKGMAPAAGAVGIIAAIVGVSVMSAPPAQTPAPTPVIAGEPAPPSATAPDPGPGGIPGLVTPQNNQQGATSGVQTSMEIVVKFKNDGLVKDIIDSFWRDQASAKAKFDAWKANRPEFAGLKLDRVTYSNELVLVHDGSVPAAQRLAAMRSIVTKLGSVADISYAEPNMTAHPGGQ